MNLFFVHPLRTHETKYRVGYSWLLCIFVLGLGAKSANCNPAAEYLLPEESPQIRLNQIGFYPAGDKLAIVVDSQATRFSLYRWGEEEPVYSGTLSDEGRWQYSMERVQKADFSAYEDTGTFYLSIPGLGRSAPFVIQASVHADLFKATMKSFYYLRCSSPLEERWAGPWAHPMAHADQDVMIHASAASAGRKVGTRVSAPKGWYDAGDYGKYTPTATFATWEMLHLYETYPDYMNKISWEIPESANDWPDLLDEAKWSLDFLLDMQEPTEGFVYHKLTTVKHARKVMPQADLGQRFMVGKGTAATLSFAAVMAQAARVLRPFDRAYADRCLEAARKAWKWGRAHPDVAFMKNPEGIHTGTCKDDFFGDDLNWAATELYLTTGEDSFFLATNGLGEDRLKQMPNRRNTQVLPYLSLLLHQDALARTGKETAIRKTFLHLADRYCAYTVKESAYQTPIGFKKTDFNWGSNGKLAGQGIVLLGAWHHTGEERYHVAALGALDYLLGRNALNLCFVTGYGQRAPLNIHHRPSYADGVAEPVPGFLAGGPQNIVKADRCTYPNSLPALRYLDDWCSFTTNEVAINWNAPLVHLVGGIEAEMQQNR